MRANYDRLSDTLAQSPFGQPMTLESNEAGDLFTGHVHALIDNPFADVRAALGNTGSWCDILILHPNVMGCHHREAALPGGDASVGVLIGKAEQPANFAFHIAANRSDYLDVRLSAPTGPLGTTDYRIRLEATPLDERHTILHLMYSNRYGAAARMAMRVYLETLGRGKVGFTVVGHNADGSPIHVGDFRGAQERNAMRYYLAITAYLDSLSAPPARQFEKRLAIWYASSARYAAQLHEGREYLDIRRRVARESKLAVEQPG
ncbi:MAG TPA: hypothetical protein VJV77_03410 [Casimicrobiaceae bacterium]|nr:hypothetical protein [Casimicrobiaceae bacterium]